MEISIQALIAEHREVEEALDALADGVTCEAIDVETVRRVHAMCMRHFDREEAFLVRLGKRDAGLAAKLRGQHEEAIEIAVRLEEALLAGDRRDAMYLARRLLAIAQHNIIEEERDVFPFEGDAPGA